MWGRGEGVVRHMDADYILREGGRRGGVRRGAGGGVGGRRRALDAQPTDAGTGILTRRGYGLGKLVRYGEIVRELKYDIRIQTIVYGLSAPKNLYPVRKI